MLYQFYMQIMHHSFEILTLHLLNSAIRSFGDGQGIEGLNEWGINFEFPCSGSKCHALRSDIAKIYSIQTALLCIFRFYYKCKISSLFLLLLGMVCVQRAHNSMVPCFRVHECVCVSYRLHSTCSYQYLWLQTDWFVS